MSYNFRDHPTPTLHCEIDSTGCVILSEGNPQGDLLTESYSGSSVQVTVAPPRGWSLQSINWGNGTGGVLTVPAPGIEESHNFNFTVAQNGTSLSANGVFKVKKTSNGTGG